VVAIGCVVAAFVMAISAFVYRRGYDARMARLEGRIAARGDGSEAVQPPEQSRHQEF
jgi:hypothetical protein